MPIIVMKFFRSLDKLFLITVVIPTIMAAIYFGFIASDVYISESKFVIRSPEKQRSTGLGVFLSSAGFSSSSEETHAVVEYVRSRDAMNALNRDGYVANAFKRSGVSFVDRFGGLFGMYSNEHLFQYYSNKVDIEYDVTSLATKLTVRAFSPEDAQEINRRLLLNSEALVNRLMTRGRQDLIKFAANEVEEAKAKARSAAISLASFRTREGVVDPEQQATIQLQMIAKMQDELIAARGQLQQLRAFTPQNPQVPVLATRIKGLEREIDSESAKITGGRRSLAGSAVQYQQLQLESQFADKQLASALASLQDARNDARRKQAYVERIAEPSRPDYPLEPRRIRNILATIVLGLVAWGILRMLLAGVREHRD